MGNNMRTSFLGRRSLLAGLLAGVVALAVAHDDAARHGRRVAPASLTDVLPEVAAWKAEGGLDVARSSARQQTRAADPLGRACRRPGEPTRRDGLAAAGGKADGASSAVLARNELVFVVPVGASQPPTGPAALPGPLGKRALAGENVPAGKYAKAALEHAGVWAAVAPRVVRADDVRMTLKWVSAGEADGGVVYRTDAPSIRRSSSRSPSGRRASADHLPRGGRGRLAARGGRGAVPRVLPRADGPGDLRPARLRACGAMNALAATDPIRLSVGVAAWATALAAPCAVALGWVLARKRFPGKALLSTLVRWCSCP
jgi:molybdate transport system substrate-binding protein